MTQPLSPVNMDMPLRDLAEAIAEALRKGGLVDPSDDTTPVFLAGGNRKTNLIENWLSAVDSGYRIAQWLRWGPAHAPVPCQVDVYVPCEHPQYGPGEKRQPCGYPSRAGVCEQHHEADELDRFLTLWGDNPNTPPGVEAVEVTARSFISGDDVRTDGPRARLAALTAHAALMAGSGAPTDALKPRATP